MDSLSEVTTVAISVGIPDDSTVYQKSTALHHWFFGYEFPETLMLIDMDENVAIVTSPKKASLLECLTQGSSVTLYKKSKDVSEYSSTWNSIDKSFGLKHQALGVLSKDKADSPLLSSWLEFVTSLSIKSSDISTGISNILVAKDEEEHQWIKLASKCSSLIMKDFVVDKLLTIIDEEKKVTHEQLSELVESTILEDSKKRKVKFPVDAQLDLMEMCFPAIIQSGGNYNLKPSAQSSSEKLAFDTIICSLGVRYKSYCSNISRTFLVEPKEDQEKNYKFLLDLQKYVLTLLRPGTLLKDVYQQGLDYVKQHRPDLEKHLVPNFGFSTGIEFRESDYLISSKNTNDIVSGMTVDLSLGFSDLKADGKTYALLLADTILISKHDTTILTDVLKKASDVLFYFKNEEESESEEEAPVVEPVKARLRKDVRQFDATLMKKREKHQNELLQLRIQESLTKYADDADQDSASTGRKGFESYESYRRDTFPKDIRDNKIFVDRKNDTVVLPIYGSAVPFHIKTIKNVSKSEEGEFIHLRINFNAPGRVGPAASATSAPTFDMSDPTAQFIRAISYRSADHPHLASIYKEIVDLRKAVTLKETEQKERADLVEQGTLVENPAVKFGTAGKRPSSYKLSDVYMRPVLEGKRVTGDLEIHANGVRYRSVLGGTRGAADQKCDILFSNVQHLFFQPCDKELIVLIHFHLKHPILIGKKKTKDVQFYREAMDAIVDETGGLAKKRKPYGSRYGGDEDEIMEEQEERRRRATLNLEFKNFCESLTAAESSLHVDIPIRELGFPGVPFRQNVFLMPTRDCLVHLSDPPFLVINLADVEVVSLERVLFHLKNFDALFVFKDHKLPPQHVDAIPMSFLEPIKDWLDSSDVYYMTSNINFNWTNVMKTINDDPIGFYDMGGWTVIQANPDQASSDSEEEHSSVFDESELEESESDESDESAYSEEDSDSVVSESEESDEDAMSWDELEEFTKKQEKNQREGVPSRRK